MFIILVLLSQSCRKKKFKCDSEAVSFQSQILPLIGSKCNSCHTFNTYGSLKNLSDQGLLKARTIDDATMPPRGQQKLSNKDKQKIYCWIEQGAPNN